VAEGSGGEAANVRIVASPPSELEDKSLAELHELAAARGVPRFRGLRRKELIEALAGDGESRLEIGELEELEDEPGHRGLSGGPAPPAELRARAEEEEEEEAETSTGVLEIVPDGFGFLRVDGFGRSPDDVFVTRAQIRALGLRSGDELSGPLRPRRRSERHASLAEVQMVNGRPADEVSERPAFEDLTPVHPRARLSLGGGSGDLTLRMLDLVAPPVKGGRVLISGPPRAGATTLLRRLLEGATADSSLVPIVLLVDARPEEIADWQRSAAYPVYGSPADASAEAAIELATIALERGRRLVEQGDDVLLAIDSLSRLARAHALGRSRSRGDDQAAAVQLAKRWFATGRDTEQAGSLTIAGTAHHGGLLHEALADVATAEVVLDAELAAAGVDPPIDVRRSFVRFEDELVNESEQQRRLHAAVQPLPAREAWDHVAGQIRSSVY
jgi:transcription termination factor Rho